MKSIRYIIILLVIFSACAPVYIPNTHNAALFRGAGEFQGSVHLSEGIDAQGAVSVSQHIGLMGNYAYTNRTSSDVDNDNYVHHQFWEGALGYYQNSDKFCYEIFAGFGQGEGTSYGNYSWFSSTDTEATGKYNRIFIQPSIGSNHRIFNWIATARISYVDFQSFTSDTQVITYNNPVVFFEPAFTGRIFFGQSPIYSQFQAGLSMTVEEQLPFDYEPFQFSIGFGFRLGGKLKVAGQ